HARRLAEGMAAGGLDAEAWPLFRLELVLIDDQSFDLVWCVHHAIMDGWSQGLLDRDLLPLARRISDRRFTPLRPPRTNFRPRRGPCLLAAPPRWSGPGPAARGPPRPGSRRTGDRGGAEGADARCERPAPAVGRCPRGDTRHSLSRRPRHPRADRHAAGRSGG